MTQNDPFFDDMSEEDRDNMLLDACMGQILWKYLEQLEDADGGELEEIASLLMKDVNELLSEAGEVVH